MLKTFWLRLMAITCVALSACNGANRSEVSARSDAPAWQHLLGSIHEHSGFSDGEVGTTPADYFAAGAQQGLDYMIGTEHSDNAQLPVTASTDCVSAQLPDCLQLSPEGLSKWNSTASMAAAASSESFTAVRGFEWTSDRFGHINVLFSANDINAKTGTGYLVSMEDFWLWLALPANLGGGGDGLVVFNHPGREDMLHTACENLGPLEDVCGTVYNGDPAYAFNDFAYRADADAQVVGIEMYGKSNHYYDGDNGAPAGGWYAYALDKGWHLGPVGAEDEHGTAWATPERAKTVLLASDRSAEALREALQARRFYALAHGYNAVRLNLSAHADQGSDRWPMGSQLRLPADTELELRINVAGLQQPRIEWIGAGGEVVDFADAAEHSHRVSVSNASEQYRFARVLDLADQDGDEALAEVVAVSAPIWFSSEAATRR